jgi:uncharacterized protein YraI
MSGSRLTSAALLAACLSQTTGAAAEPYAQRSPAVRGLYTGVAVVANVMPVVSALFVPKCLPGYIVCKLTFVAGSILVAADQLAMSGGADRIQTQAILRRGFSGDWVLTGRHIAGDTQAEPLPAVAPPSETDRGAWQPPSP